MTSYPNSIDTDADIPLVTDNVTEISGVSVNAIRESIFAIENTLGENPQGSTDSVVERLNVITNNDGTFKSSALIAAGLVALPITDSQVGTTAAIQESKLDLDVPTQGLQNQITSNDIDIQNLQTLANLTLNRLGEHIGGSDFNHDGYDVLISSLLGNTNIDNVGLALDYILDSLNRHKSSIVPGEHHAEAITFTPTSDGVITATNVQDAVASIDDAFVEDRRLHNDTAHSNGVSKDGYIAFNGQANINDASLRLSRYETFSGTDIVKIGLANAAVIKTKGFDPIALNVAAQSVAFEVKIGNASSLIEVSGLHTAAYPSSNNRFTVKAVVSRLNDEFAKASNHIPLQAYECDDGEIAIQHNIAREDCTIIVRNPSSNSAITALGLTDLVTFEIRPVDNCRFIINGRPFGELRTISTSSLTLSGATSTIDLGQIVDTSGTNGLGIHANSLFHVFNHTTSSANGTYSVQTISAYPGTTLNLNTSLDAGTFDYIIYDDTISVGTPSVPQTYDFYLSDQRISYSQIRAAVPILGISGIAIVGVSSDMGDATGTLTVDSVSGKYVFNLTIGSDTGIDASVDIGYIGYLNVYAPNNVDYITILIFATSISTPASDSITFTAAEPQDTLFFLGTSSFDSAATIEIPIDGRNTGLVGKTAIGKEVEDGIIGRNIRNFGSSGVIRGFEATNDSTTITVQGGQAYVYGSFFEKDGSTISALNQASSDGIWNLVLNKYGAFDIFNDSTAGYSLANIINSQIYCILAQFTVLSGAITELVDARLFVNSIPNKIGITVDDRDFGFGTFRTIDAAILYADNLIVDSNANIKVLSDITISSDLTITADKTVEIYASLTAAADINIEVRSTLALFNNADITGDIVLNDNSKLVLSKGIVVNGSITLSNNCTLELTDDVAVSQIIIDGYGSSIRGTNSGRSIISLDGSTSPGILINDSEAFLVNVTIQTGNFAISGIGFDDGSDNAVLDNCFIRQNYTVNETNWASTSRSGIVNLSATAVDGIEIINCRLDNWADAISGENNGAGQTEFSGLLIDSCTITNCGRGFYFENLSSSRINNNIVSNVKFNHFKVQDALSDTMVSNNIFETQSSTSSSLIMMSLPTTVNSIIENNLFSDADCTSVLFAGATDSIFNFSNNIIVGCNTGDDYLFDLSAATNSTITINNNIINNHTGNIVTANSVVFVDNTISTTSNTSTVEAIIFDADTVYSRVADNTLVIVSNKGISLTDTNFDNNIVSASYMTITNQELNFTVRGNRIDLTDASQVYGIILTSGFSNLYAEFAYNDLTTAASGASFFVDDGGQVLIENNIIRDNTADSVLEINVAALVKIHNNSFYISDGTDYIILNRSDDVSIIGNTLSDPDSSVSLIAAISCDNGTENIIICDNFLNGSGSNADLIQHLDPSPINVFVGSNKGALAAVTYSALNGKTSGLTFEDGATDKFFQTNSTSGELVVPFYLPPGVKLVSAQVFINAPSTGCFTITLYKRAVSTVNAATISSGATNSSSGSTTVSVSPTSATYILSNTEYFLVCTNTATGIDIGSITVNYKW